MCWAEASEIVGGVVAGVVVEVSSRQAGGKLQAAHRATFKGIMLAENPAGLGLVADWGWALGARRGRTASQVLVRESALLGVWNLGMHCMTFRVAAVTTHYSFSPFGKNALSISIGIGKTMVELRSLAMAASVLR